MNEPLQHLRNALDFSNCDDWKIVREGDEVIVVSPGGIRFRAVSSVEDGTIWKLTRLEEP